MLKRHAVRVLVLALVAGGGWDVAWASDPVEERPTAAAARTATALRSDGAPTDALWAAAEPITGFVQREPDEGAPPTFLTEARVAYDAEAIYVAVRAFDDTPAEIVGHLTRRDTNSPSDWIVVLIDSYFDRRTAYEFAVNAAGVKRDTYWFNDNNQDSSWDAVWDVRVARDARGWRAEFRIPLSQLRFDPAAARTFGFALVRRIGRLNETSTWPLLPRGATGYVSSFGELGGLALAGSTRRLELMPYVVSQIEAQPTEEGNPFIDATSPGGAVGADLKFALTPGLTLTATINPDFGQVEADPAVVNLSAFETFFSERRPFFIEGANNFSFGIDCNDGNCTGLFYSRRIGRAPQTSADVPDEGFASTPGQTTILGAAKLTGRIGRYSIGVLNAVTGEEQAELALGAARWRETVEPLTSYSIARVRREFENQSTLGFIVTSTNRQAGTTGDRVAGAANTGGVDWDWRLRGSRYALRGFWAGSSVRGTPEAILRTQESNVHSFQRPDAGHVRLDPTRTSLGGHAGALGFAKIAGDRVQFSTDVRYKSPGFEINDLGFLTRADQIFQSNWIQLRRDQPSKYFRSIRINFNQWSSWNFGGDRLFAGGNVNAHAVFANNWSTGGGVNVSAGGISDRHTRGGPGLRDNGNLNGWMYLNTDDRQPVAFNYFSFGRTDRTGSWAFELGPGVTVRPSPAVSVRLGVRYSRNVDDYQWIAKVTDVDDHFVVGHLEQTTVALTSRVNYTITPDLSIQLYGEPFVSAGDYTSFREIVDGRAERYEDRFAPFAYADNPDFNFRSFRTTNVLRWEYRPGSVLFVVWQQAREASVERGDFRFGRDFGAAFDASGRNVFLVKLSYWFNF